MLRLIPLTLALQLAAPASARAHAPAPRATSSAPAQTATVPTPPLLASASAKTATVAAPPRLALAPALEGTSASPADAATPPADDPLVKQAKQAYATHRYAEAAALFDQLWERDADPRHLYNGAAAHTAAANDIAAYQRYLRYIHHDRVTDADRREARQNLSRLLATFAPLRITVEPAALHPHARLLATDSAGVTHDFPLATPDLQSPHPRRLHLPPGTWSFRLLLGGPLADLYTVSPLVIDLPLPEGRTPSAPPELTFVATRPAATLHLTLGPEIALVRPVDLLFEDLHRIEPPIRLDTQERDLQQRLPAGPWRYTIAPRVRRGKTHRGELTLAPATDTTLQVLDLRADRPTRIPSDDRTRHLLAITLGATSIALVTPGIILIRVGHQRLDKERAPQGYQQAAFPALGMMNAGSGILGAGLGVGASLAMVPLVKQPRSLGIQAGVGGSLALAGAIWHGVEFHRYRSQPDDSTVAPLAPRSAVDDYKIPLTVSSAIIGTGVGLALGAASRLVIGRPRKTAHLAIMASPSSTVLTATTRF